MNNLFKNIAYLDSKLLIIFAKFEFKKRFKMIYSILWIISKIVKLLFATQ